jgi:hypothetical protein
LKYESKGNDREIRWRLEIGDDDGRATIGKRVEIGGKILLWWERRKKKMKGRFLRTGEEGSKSFFLILTLIFKLMIKIDF